MDIGSTECFWRSNVCLENVQNITDDLRIFQTIHRFLRFQDDRVPNIVGQLHVFIDQLRLLSIFCTRCNHVAHRFVERVHLMWFQMTDDAVDVRQNFIDECLRFAQLDSDEMTTAFLSDLDECITGHVLNTFVSFWKRKRGRWEKEEWEDVYRAWIRTACSPLSSETSNGREGNEDIDRRRTWCSTRWSLCYPCHVFVRISRVIPNRSRRSSREQRRRDLLWSPWRENVSRHLPPSHPKSTQWPNRAKRRISMRNILSRQTLPYSDSSMTIPIRSPDWPISPSWSIQSQHSPNASNRLETETVNHPGRPSSYPRFHACSCKDWSHRCLSWTLARLLHVHFPRRELLRVEPSVRSSFVEPNKTKFVEVEDGRKLISTYTGELRAVELSSRWNVVRVVAVAQVRRGRLLVGGFSVEFSAENVPIFQADLEDFDFLHFRDQNEILDSFEQRLLQVRGAFDQDAVFF